MTNWQNALDAGAEIAGEDGSQLYDPVLGEIAGARRAVVEAQQQLRLLLAYAREFVTPRPYTLAHLAHAAGMSISGVRTAYGSNEIQEVARRIGTRPRPTPTPTPHALTTGDVVPRPRGPSPS